MNCVAGNSDFDAWRADGGRVLSDTCALIIKERGRRREN